jgi:Holliday junction resolvasome RuvABC endonuclease subunit
MKRNTPTHPRILAIAPSTRGFGYAVLEGRETLVDWGAKAAAGDKNTWCIGKVKELLAHYKPEAMVLHDHLSKGSRRPVRIRVLCHGIIDMAPNHNVSVALFSKEQIDKVFFANGEGTKRDRAEILANRFPDELGFLLPPIRRAWMTEDHRMDIFEAVALALTLRSRWHSNPADTSKR